MRRDVNESVRAQLLTYMWYNETTGFYEELQREFCFFPLSHRDSLAPFALPTRSVAVVDEMETWCNLETDHDMCHLEFTLFFKLRKLVCNHFIYRLEDEEVLNSPSIHFLLRGFGNNYRSFIPN